MRRMADEDSGGFGLSFMDLVSCALGGMIVLLVIFAARVGQSSGTADDATGAATAATPPTGNLSFVEPILVVELRWLGIAPKPRSIDANWQKAGENNNDSRARQRIANFDRGMSIISWNHDRRENGRYEFVSTIESAWKSDNEQFGRAILKNSDVDAAPVENQSPTESDGSGRTRRSPVTTSNDTTATKRVASEESQSIPGNRQRPPRNDVIEENQLSIMNDGPDRRWDANRELWLEVICQTSSGTKKYRFKDTGRRGNWELKISVRASPEGYALAEVAADVKPRTTR